MKQENFNEEMNFINAPQFPGQQLGNVPIEKIRALIKRQKRLKGYSFQVPSGTSSFNLDLSGTARVLLGLALYPGKDPDAEITSVCCGDFKLISQLQFVVNNEIVIDQVHPNFLTNNFNNNEYYYIPRPLSGTDIITINFLNPQADDETCNVVIYYI